MIPAPGGAEDSKVRYDRTRLGEKSLSFTYAAGAFHTDAKGNEVVTEDFVIGSFACAGKTIHVVDGNIGNGNGDVTTRDFGVWTMTRLPGQPLGLWLPPDQAEKLYTFCNTAP
jgi:hypothetical protein